MQWKGLLEPAPRPAGTRTRRWAGWLGAAVWLAWTPGPAPVGQNSLPQQAQGAPVSLVRLAVETPGRSERATADALYPHFAAAGGAAEGTKMALLPSADLVDWKLRQVGWGLAAALAERAHTGGGKAGYGRTALLRSLAAGLASRLDREATTLSPLERAALERATLYVAGALEAASTPSPVPEPLRTKAKEAAQELVTREGLAAPSGYFGWTDGLGSAYRSIRFLQQGLEVANDEGLGAALLIAQAIATDPALASAADELEDLGSIVTGPAPDAGWRRVVSDAAWPARGGQEGLSPGLLRQVRDALAARLPEVSVVTLAPGLLFPEQALAAGLPPRDAGGRDCFLLLAARLRMGAGRVVGGPPRGFFPALAAAEEPRLLPERAAERAWVQMSPGYLRLALRLGASQADQPASSPIARAAGVQPSRLRLEPQASHFLRVARAFRAFREEIEGLLGRTALREMKRIGPGQAEGGKRLDDELTEAEQLAWGAYLITCAALGMQPELEEGELRPDQQQAARAAAQNWLAQWADDPDMDQDVRGAVPVASFREGDQTRRTVWATIGVRLVKISCSAPPIAPAAVSYWLPVTCLVPLVGQPQSVPGDEELRRICRANQSEERIRVALAGIGLSPSASQPTSGGARVEEHRWPPMWLLLLAAAVVAVWAVSRVRRKVRRRLLKRRLTK